MLSKTENVTSMLSRLMISLPVINCKNSDSDFPCNERIYCFKWSRHCRSWSVAGSDLINFKILRAVGFSFCTIIGVQVLRLSAKCFLQWEFDSTCRGQKTSTPNALRNSLNHFNKTRLLQTNETKHKLLVNYKPKA